MSDRVNTVDWEKVLSLPNVEIHKPNPINLTMMEYEALVQNVAPLCIQSIWLPVVDALAKQPAETKFFSIADFSDAPSFMEHLYNHWKNKLFRSQMNGGNDGASKIARIRKGTQNGHKISSIVSDIRSTLNQAASIWRITHPPDEFITDQDYVDMDLDELAEAVLDPDFYKGFVYFLETSCESGRIKPKVVENDVCDLISFLNKIQMGLEQEKTPNFIELRIKLADLHSWLKEKREHWKNLAKLRDQSKLGLDTLKEENKLLQRKHLRFILCRVYILIARAIQWRKTNPDKWLDRATAQRIQDGINVLLHFICGGQRHEFVYDLTLMSFRYDAVNKIFYFTLQDEKQLRIDAGIVALPYEIGRIISFFLSDVRISLLDESEREFYLAWIATGKIVDLAKRKLYRDKLIKKNMGVSLLVGPKGLVITPNSACDGVHRFVSSIEEIKNVTPATIRSMVATMVFNGTIDFPGMTQSDKLVSYARLINSSPRTILQNYNRDNLIVDSFRSVSNIAKSCTNAIAEEFRDDYILAELDPLSIEEIHATAEVEDDAELELEEHDKAPLSMSEMEYLQTFKAPFPIFNMNNESVPIVRESKTELNKNRSQLHGKFEQQMALIIKLTKDIQNGHYDFKKNGYVPPPNYQFKQKLVFDIFNGSSRASTGQSTSTTSAKRRKLQNKKK